MRLITKLFGRSPFGPLQEHMTIVRECAGKLPELFDAMKKNDRPRFAHAVEDISKLEHQADLKKNEIRSHLPKTTFLPVAREDLLDILSIQDSIADVAEDASSLLSMKVMQFPEELEPEFDVFLKKVIQTVDKAWEVLDQIDELVEFTFGGPEADKVHKIIDEVCYLEHEGDIAQMKMLQKFLNLEDKFSKGEFFILMKSLEKAADVANYAEKLSNRIRTLLLTD